MTTTTLLSITIDIPVRWAVAGVPNADEEVSLPVHRDPLSQSTHGYLPHIPGSSLAGSLRRHLEKDLAKHWLGPPPGDREVKTGRLALTRSRLWLLGCVISDEASVETRGVTSIDARRGAADDHTKRDEQWVEPCRITVCAEHEGPPDDVLLTRLQNWEPVIGRSRSTGMGRAVVKSIRMVTINLDDDDHLTWWLQGQRSDWFTGQAAPPRGVVEQAHMRQSEPAMSAEIALDVTWELREPLHVGSGDDPQAAPGGEPRNRVADVVRTGGRCMVPGSSWKGVFRHRVAFILDQCGATSVEREGVIDMLFGSTSRRGALVFEDSLLVDGAELTRTHVPIDRFTGGALDGGLHQFAAVASGGMMTQRVTAAEALAPALTNLLHHVVRDLSEGLIGVGGAISRGYGHVETTNATPPEPVVLADVLDGIRARPRPASDKEAR